MPGRKSKTGFRQTQGVEYDPAACANRQPVSGGKSMRRVIALLTLPLLAACEQEPKLTLAEQVQLPNQFLGFMAERTVQPGEVVR